MIDFSNRRFTIRIGRGNKPLRNGDQLGRRTSVVGRRTSTRRVSVRNSTALGRAPSGAGGLHRGASVRRSQSGIRRGASVKRAPSAARRNSKRISTLVVGGGPGLSSTAQTVPATNASQVTPTEVTLPQITSPASSKSFFSKLTSRFRGRSKTPKTQPEHPSLPPISTSQGSPNGTTAILPTANLAPIASPLPRTPSLRSPSPGRVTFADTPVETTKVSDTLPVPTANPELGPSPVVAEASSAQVGSPIAPTVEVVEANDEDDNDEEWVDAEDDDSDLEPHTAMSAKPDAQVDSVHAGSTVRQYVTPGASFGESQGAEVSTSTKDPLTTSEGAGLGQTSEDQPKANALLVPLQVSLLNDLSHDTVGPGARVSQWLAVTPAATIGQPENIIEGEQEKNSDHVNGAETSSSTAASPKRESKQRPRPPQIVVPTLASNNPYRTPLPPSPSPSNLGSNLLENNPLRSPALIQPGLFVEASTAEVSVPPPSPSILLTPAHEFDDLTGFEFTRKSNDTLFVDGAQIPLPPSPSPSNVSASPDSDEAPSIPSPLSDKPTVARASSTSTSGGRSLSTAPSTHGPATPTSMRFPGHPAFANFTFGGPSSPSLKVEDWEEGEDERRGRSLEVNEGKRSMRSVSPKLDAVLEGDESRRSSRASLEEIDHAAKSGDKPGPSLLPSVEEVVKFGKKSTDDDSDSEHEDECGFYAFAEQKLEEEKKVAEARQLEVPKRSKTMSFLNVGFRKRKSTIGDVPPSPTLPATVTRSATSARHLAPPGAGPKRSSTLVVPSGGKRISRLVPGQRSSTLMAEPLNPREALSPTMYTAGDIQAAAGEIEDDESRRLSEAAFMF